MITNEAHKLCQKAVKEGRLIRPDKCSNCGVSCKPIGHHPDYDKPLEVVWLCVKCHRILHITFGKGKNHGGTIGTNIYVDDETKKELDKLAEKDHRAITDEIKFLIDKYKAELKKKQ